MSSIETVDAYGAWKRVLGKYVDGKGRVDFKGLSASQMDFSDLKLFVTYISLFSPRTTPERFQNENEELAFYINAYNALAMYGVILEGIPEDLATAVKRTNFFYINEFVIGGEEMSLYTFENEVIRAYGDERIHFAVNCMSVGCPRLPQEPFEAKTLDTQLTSAAEEFFNSSAYVKPGGPGEKPQVSEILSFYTEDFVKEGVADSLAEYVNKYRQDPIRQGQGVDFIPYDWTINAQPLP